VPANTFQLHLITDNLKAREMWLPRVLAGARGGVDWIQLRDSGAAAGDLLEHARMLRAALQDDPRSRHVRLSVNDRLDVALAAGADGVHLPGRALPVPAAQSVAAGRLLVGRSVHGLEESVRAAEDGADYLTYGHVFPSRSKPGLPPRGLDELARIVARVDVPVLAIGGITATNLPRVLATGCAGIAVISAVLSAGDPEQAALDLRAELDRSPYQPRHPFSPMPREETHEAYRQSAAV
jgi:thiamine-phosphate pyrophosphorylase